MNLAKKDPKMICSFCLADPYSTSTNQNPKMRCPVCASAYNGLSRIEEFNVLEKAGLVKALRR